MIRENRIVRPTTSLREGTTLLRLEISNTPTAPTRESATSHLRENHVAMTNLRSPLEPLPLGLVANARPRQWRLLLDLLLLSAPPLDLVPQPDHHRARVEHQLSGVTLRREGEAALVEVISPQEGVEDLAAVSEELVEAGLVVAVQMQGLLEAEETLALAGEEVKLVMLHLAAYLSRFSALQLDPQRLCQVVNLHLDLGAPFPEARRLPFPDNRV